MAKWERNYVREKYKVAMLGVEGVFFPARDAKRLMVFFSSMGVDRYDRYSWFWNDAEEWVETSYLFIKDDSFNYFLGTDEKPMKDSVRKVVNHYQELLKVESHQTYTVGSSMGGYAAIYYAFYLKAKAAIVANPQVTLRAAQMHEFQNWERNIRKTGQQWIDLDILLFRNTYRPGIYLEYGEYPADKKACEKLISTLMETCCLLIVRKEESKDHSSCKLSKQTIENAVNFFENEPAPTST